MTLATFLQWQFASNSCTVNASLAQAESSNCPFGRAGDAAKKAMDALERRDAARQLRTDLDAGRKGQGWMAKKMADWLPEKSAEWVKGLF